MSRPRALDLFSCAGGSSKGLHDAGFEVVGVDIKHQKRYPFQFHQADWYEFLMENYQDFDLIVAGPPCQGYSITALLSNGNHPKLIGPVRDALIATSKPYIIENVPGAPLINPVMLCGTMFPELCVRRHRLFECNPPILFSPYTCNHWGNTSASGRGKGKRNPNGYIPGNLENFDFITVVGGDYIAESGRRAMGIDWMTKKELSQAIPPAYFEWLGRQMIERIF